MDLLAEYASDSESNSNTSDGNECETVNADKDLNAGAVRQVCLVTYRKKFKRANPGGKTKGDCFMSKVFRHLYSH